MDEELRKLVGTKVPIKTRSGGRHLDYVHEVRDEIVVLTTNADGSGRRTVLALAEIESFTGGESAVAEVVRYK